MFKTVLVLAITLTSAISAAQESSMLFSLCADEISENVIGMAKNSCEVNNNTVPVAVNISAAINMNVGAASLKTSKGYYVSMISYRCKNSETLSMGLVTYRPFDKTKDTLGNGEYVQGKCAFTGPGGTSAENVLK